MRNLLNKSRISIFLSNIFRNTFYFIIIFFAFALPIKSQWYGALIPDFKVNDDLTTYNQMTPCVGVDESGNFNIVWIDQRNTTIGLPIQRYFQIINYDGTRSGINNLIGHDTSGSGMITVLKNGDFIIAGNGKVNGINDIYFQRYHRNGTVNGGLFKVNDISTSVLYATLGDIGSDSIGNFVIVWTDYQNGPNNPDCYGQKYDSTGNRIGNNFKINDNTNNTAQLQPKLAVNKDGSFTVCWTDHRSVFNGDVYFQHYNKNGNLIGINQRVDDEVINARQGLSDISSDGYGYFVIVFDDYREFFNVSQVYYQLYDSLGNKIGVNRKANENTLHSAYNCKVSMQKNGNFVIEWSDNRSNVIFPYAQRYQKDGTAFGVNFKIPEINSNVNYGGVDVFLQNDRIYTTWSDTRYGNYDIFANVKSFINPDSILSSINTQSEIVTQYRLYTAYPNPFNPVSTIKYDIPKQSQVTIKIFDIIGREVAALVNDTKEPGFYTVSFDGTNYSSGVYFYRIEARQAGSSTVTFINVKKMVLLK